MSSGNLMTIFLYKVTLERMLEESGLKNESSIAKSLGISPQAFSNFKKNGEIPAERVIQFALKYKLSIDYLLTGEGQHKREGKDWIIDRIGEKMSQYCINSGDDRILKILELLNKEPESERQLLLDLLESRSRAREVWEKLKP
jgi:hypothetical protein